MVWRETTNMAGPRVVQIWHDRTTKKIRSDIPIPVQLQICKESRSVGLQYYQHVFNIGPSAGGVYANLKEDWIYLSTGPDVPCHPHLWLEHFLDAVLRGEREAIQNLAIYFNGGSHLHWRNLRRLTSLKQVALISFAPECFGHVLEKSPPLCRQQLEHIWRKKAEYALQRLTAISREWKAHCKRTRGTWQPPVVMQWCLHALKPVTRSKKVEKGIRHTDLARTGNA
jgi:hypothetical protein